MHLYYERSHRFFIFSIAESTVLRQYRTMIQLGANKLTNIQLYRTLPYLIVYQITYDLIHIIIMVHMFNTKKKHSCEIVEVPILRKIGNTHVGLKL